MAFENPLKAIWRSGRASYGGWTGSPDPIVAAWIASCGFDEVLVDQQHGAIEANQLGGIFAAIAVRGVIPTTRVPSHDPAAIGKSLDLGAMAVIAPMVNNAAEAAGIVRAACFPPIGTRSFGPILAHLDLGEDPRDLETPAIIVMIETAEGLANCEEIAATPGVDAIYIGPADLSLAIGVPWQRSRRTADQAKAHADAVERVRRACDKSGIVAGMNCSEGALARGYVEQGFRMVTVTVDADMIPRDGMRELAIAKGQSPG
jgi:4-hydroxy-2-oxoheptanedioate aldolase